MRKSTRPVTKEEPGKKSDKPKVVLDTNVIVSALLSPEGTAAQILSLFSFDAIQVCYDKAVLSEYEVVMTRPKFKAKITHKMVCSVLEPLKENGLSYEIPAASVFPMQDESDRVFYDVAKTAGAFLVTGNKKHYPDESFIVTPRDFMDTLINS